MLSTSLQYHLSLWTVFIDRFIKSVHPVRQKIVLNHFSSLSNLMVYVLRSDSEKNRLDIPQEIIVLFRILIEKDPKCMTGVRQVVLKSICGISVLASFQTGRCPDRGNFGGNYHQNMCLHEALKTMDVYQEQPFYITASKFGKVDVNLPKHPELGETKSVPEEIVHIKNEGYSSGMETKRTGWKFQSFLYKSAHRDLLEQMAEHEAVKYKNKEAFWNDSHKYLQLLEKCEKLLLDILLICTGFQSLWNG